MKLEVFDPPMCCSTGICGTHVDPKLVVFASDLEWLKTQGVDVKRHGLSFEPAEFVKNEAVKDTIQSDGNDCLPIIVVDGRIVSTACYPSREKLASICDIEFNQEEAPPVHREENCCCGVDCDCRLPQSDENPISGYDKGDCANSPAEQNCTCGAECDCHKSFFRRNFKKILFILFVLVIFAIIFFRSCCTVGATENVVKSICKILPRLTN